MKRIITTAVAVATLLLLSGCNKYDELAGRVDTLESDVASLKGDLATLQTAVAEKYSIVRITEVSEGYEIIFSNNSSVTLRHGKDGAQGPQGPQGAQGTQGATGAQGPQGAAGKDGDAFFESLSVEDGVLVITLADGKHTVYRIPLAAEATPLAGVTSVVFVPEYTDGAIGFVKYEALNKVEAVADFLVTPKSAAAAIAAAGKDVVFSAKVSAAATRAVSFVDVAVVSSKVNAEEGIISLTFSGDGIEESVLASGFIFVSASDALTSVAVPAIPTVFAVEKGPEFEEYDGYFVYDGETYKTVKIGDKVWMAENLRYAPAGYTVASGCYNASSAKDNSIFYPFEAVVEEGSTILTVTKIATAEDVDLIRKKGYLYNLYGATMTEEITSENGKSLEGVQGVCPPGWHVPTRYDYLALCGYMPKSTYWGDDAAVTDETALAWDPEAAKAGCATPAKMNELGFNYIFSGLGSAVNTATVQSPYGTAAISAANTSVPEYVGLPSANLYMTSTVNISGSTVQSYSMYSSFTSSYAYGRLFINGTNALYGGAVRCVKND